MVVNYGEKFKLPKLMVIFSSFILLEHLLKKKKKKKWQVGYTVPKKPTPHSPYVRRLIQYDTWQIPTMSVILISQLLGYYYYYYLALGKLIYVYMFIKEPIQYSVGKGLKYRKCPRKFPEITGLTRSLFLLRSYL